MRLEDILEFSSCNLLDFCFFYLSIASTWGINVSVIKLLIEESPDLMCDSFVTTAYQLPYLCRHLTSLVGKKECPESSSLIIIYDL
jgi:hypothetical protein